MSGSERLEAARARIVVAQDKINAARALGFGAAVAPDMLAGQALAVVMMQRGLLTANEYAESLADVYEVTLAEVERNAPRGVK